MRPPVLAPRRAATPRSCPRLPPGARAARCLSPRTRVPGANHLSGLKRECGVSGDRRAGRAAPRARPATPRPAPPPPARPAEPARTACAGEPPACERCWDVVGRPAPRLDPGTQAQGCDALSAPASSGRVCERHSTRGPVAWGTKTPPPPAASPSSSGVSRCEGAKDSGRARGPALPEMHLEAAGRGGPFVPRCS